MSKQPPSALDAAGTLLNKLDADHLTEVRAASWALAVNLIQEHMTRFAENVCKQRVEAERERAAGIAHSWQRADALKLAAGEMTAQEVRTARAVAAGIERAIRAPAERPATPDYEAAEAKAAAQERRPISPRPEMLAAADDYMTGQCAWPPTQPIGILLADFAEQQVEAALVAERSSPPAAVMDYTEQARLVIAQATVDACCDPDEEDAHIAVYMPFLETGIAAALSAVASEHQAVERERVTFALAKVDDFRVAVSARDAKIAALRESEAAWTRRAATAIATTSRVHQKYEVEIAALKHEAEQNGAAANDMKRRAIAAQEECDVAQVVCGEAYQAVGTLARETGTFDHPDVIRLLDNLSHHDDPPHRDLLPWPKSPIASPRAALLARLREPDVRGAAAKRVADYRQHGCHWAEGTCSECQGIADAALTKITEMLK